MKRVIALILASLLCLALFACSSTNSSSNSAPAAESNAPAPAPVSPTDSNVPAPTGTSDNSIQAGETQTLKIGMIVSMTGFMAQIDIGSINDAKALVQVINDRGGWDVNGTKYKLELVTSDVASDPTQAQTAALYLIDQGIKYVILTTDFLYTGILNLWEQYGIMSIADYPTMTTYGGPDYPNVFLGNGGSIAGFSAAARTLKQAFPDVKTVAYCENDNGVNDTEYQYVVQACADVGLACSTKIVYAADQSDFTTVALQLINSGVDAYIGAGPMTNNGAIVRALRSANSDIIYACPSWQSALVLGDIIGPDGAYNYTTLGFLPAVAGGPSQIFMDTYNEYTQLFGVDDARSYTGDASNSLYTILQLMAIAKSTDVAAVINAWHTTKSFDGFYGTTSMGGSSLYGADIALTMKTGQSLSDKDGKISFLGYTDLTFPGE